jgi:hypothetical protein
VSCRCLSIMHHALQVTPNIIPLKCNTTECLSNLTGNCISGWSRPYLFSAQCPSALPRGTKFLPGLPFTIQIPILVPNAQNTYALPTIVMHCPQWLFTAQKTYVLPILVVYCLKSLSQSKLFLQPTRCICLRDTSHLIDTEGGE